MCSKNTLVWLVCLVTLVFSSCDSKLDLFGDPVEVTVIYGVLNPAEKEQFVRINKAFLTDGNALEYAALPTEDIYYFDDNGETKLVYNVVIKMSDINNPNNETTWTLDTTTLIPKDTGTFYNPWQMVYKFEAGINGAPDTLTSEYQYEIFIENRENGEIASAETQLITPFLMQKPAYSFINPQLGFNPDPSTYRREGIKWTSGVNGKIYQPIIRMNFDESVPGQGTTRKYVDWVFSTQTVDDYSTSGRTLTQPYYDMDFYNNVKSVLPSVASGVVRTPVNLQVFYWAASPELYTYMQVTNPSNSIVQERPEYTNIQGGLGLFTSRLSLIRTFKITSTTLLALTNPDNVGPDKGFVIPGK